MTMSEPGKTAAPSLAADVLSAARYYLVSRTGLIVLTATALGLGAWFNWGWLVAVGIAPLLLTFAPCAAMCALGLCSMGGKSKTANDVASPGSVDGADTKTPLSLAAPGADKDASSALSQRDQANPNSRKGCC